MNSLLSGGNGFWRGLAFLAAAIVIFPLLIIILQWGTVGTGEQAIWQHLFDTKLDRLAVNTLLRLDETTDRKSVVSSRPLSR